MTEGWTRSFNYLCMLAVGCGLTVVVVYCLHGGLSGLFHDKTINNEFFSFICKVNYFCGYMEKGTIGVKQGRRRFVF